MTESILEVKEYFQVSWGLSAVRSQGFSKGYGFVEFSEHRDALQALRSLNNCPKAAKAFNGGKRLMVDFVVEDARVVRQRRIKLARK